MYKKSKANSKRQYAGHGSIHQQQQTDESGWGFQKEEKQLQQSLKRAKPQTQQAKESGWGFQEDEAVIAQMMKQKPKQSKQPLQKLEILETTQCQCISKSTGQRCRLVASRQPREDPRFCSRYHQNCTSLATQAPQGKQSGERYKYRSLDEMMVAYGIPNAHALTDLSDDEINYLIDHIMIHENTIKLSDLLKNVTNMDDRIKRLVVELAGKLCRCLDKVEKSNPEGKVGICTKSIFHGRGLTISSHTCNPPMLKPAPFPLKDTSIGPKLVLRRKK
jgi:hypothetical protein